MNNAEQVVVVGAEQKFRPVIKIAGRSFVNKSLGGRNQIGAGPDGTVGLFNFNVERIALGEQSRPCRIGKRREQWRRVGVVLARKMRRMDGDVVGHNPHVTAALFLQKCSVAVAQDVAEIEGNHHCAGNSGDGDQHQHFPEKCAPPHLGND